MSSIARRNTVRGWIKPSYSLVSCIVVF